MMKSTGVAIIFITGCVGIISVLADNLSPQSGPVIPPYRPGSPEEVQGRQGDAGFQGGSPEEVQGKQGDTGFQGDSTEGGQRSQNYIGYPGGSLGGIQGYSGMYPGDGSEQMLAQCRAHYNIDFDVDNLPTFCNKFIGTGQLTGLRNIGGWAPGVQGGYGGFPGGWNTGVQGGLPGRLEPGYLGGVGGYPGGLAPGLQGGYVY